MIFFAKLLFGSLRGIDPLILLALICLGLSACFMALFRGTREGQDTLARQRDETPFAGAGVARCVRTAAARSPELDGYPSGILADATDVDGFIAPGDLSWRGHLDV
jgi:hypothetical protein